MPQCLNRNIKSSLLPQPEVLPTKYPNFYARPSVYSSDLGWWEYGKIKFEKNPYGRYKMADGNYLDMRGTLSTARLHYLSTSARNVRIEDFTR